MLKFCPSVGLWAPPPFKIDSADFDGVNDHMARGANLTGIANSKSGIFSAWVRFDAGTGLQAILSDGVSLEMNINVLRFASEDGSLIRVYCFDGSGTDAVAIVSATGYTASATWRHILASWDCAASAKHLYIDDFNDQDAGASNINNVTIPYASATDWRIGSDPLDDRLDGCLADVYFAPGQFLDFSVEANRRKFIRADGKPADLGANGSRPTGVAPLVFHRLDKGDFALNFAVNRGTGGNFSMTGALTVGSTSPSD